MVVAAVMRGCHDRALKLDCPSRSDDSRREQRRDMAGTGRERSD
jgi:hypothetical protein